MTDWNIQARARACEACGRSFADKEAYHTLLFDERASFRRSDVCRTCWEAQHSDGARERKGFVSHWQGVYEVPPPPSEPIQKETADSLLRKLIELNDPHYIPAAYILAVMLERKRLLKVKDQLVREGTRVFVYEHPKTGDAFTIVDPGLQLNQLEAVQHDVAALLEHGLVSPGPKQGASPLAEAAAAPAENSAPPLEAAPPIVDAASPPCPT